MTLDLRIILDGTELDKSVIVQGVEIQFGAPSGVESSGGEPSSCAFQLVNAPNVVPGQTVVIEAQYSHLGPWSPRFTGRTYSVSIDWETVQRSITTVAAAGPMSTIGRYDDNTLHYAATDGDRAFEILDLWAPGSFAADPGTVDLIEVDNSGNPNQVTALDFLRQTALSGMGMVTDTADGTVVYFDRDHVRLVDPVLNLDASTILRQISASSTTENLINTVTVEYGERYTDGTPRAALTVEDAESITLWGPYPATVDSDIANADDAGDIANEWVFRNSYPRLDLPVVQITSRQLGSAIDSVDVGAVVRLTGLPQPLPASIDAVLTSYRETWRLDSEWLCELSLVDGRYWGRGTAWEDVYRGITSTLSNNIFNDIGTNLLIAVTTNPTSWPQSFPYVISIGSGANLEDFEVTSTPGYPSGLGYAVQTGLRGLNGTTPQTHLTGAPVEVVAGLRWIDVPDDVTWYAIPDALLDGTGTNRWKDTPANYLFATIPATAWEDWTG